MVATEVAPRPTPQLGRRSRDIRARRIGWCLVFTTLVVLGPIVGPRTAQPASRYSLTAAIVDHGTVDLGRYQDVLGIDHALYEGRWRSDKGPGQPLLAVPVYAAARALGADALDGSRSPRNDLVLWWLTFTTATVPFALLLMVVYRTAARSFPATALVATLAVMLGSIALPHAVNLYAHSLSALLGFSAYAVLRPPTAARRLASWRLVAAGALAGAAVATEYHLAIVALVVGTLVVVRCRWRSLWTAVGAVVPLLVLAVYQWRAFGVPWHTPFAYYAGTLGGTTEGGYGVPSLRAFDSFLLGNRGLLISGPIVLCAAVAALAGLRRSSTSREASLVAVVVFVGYSLLVTGWSGTPFLEEPGPRYLIPALPFLVTPLAAAWPRLRGVARIAAWWGIALMGAATATFVLVATDDTPVNAYVNRVANGRFLATVWTLAFGQIGLWLYAASVALALRWFWHSAKVAPRG